MIYPKNCPNQTRDYWLIAPNQQTFCIETDNSRQLQISKRAIRKQQANAK